MKKYLLFLILFICELKFTQETQKELSKAEAKKMADFRTKLIRELGLDINGKIKRPQFYQFVYRTLTNDNKLAIDVVETFKSVTNLIVNQAPEEFDVKDIFKYMSSKSLDSLLNELKLNKKEL